MSMMVRVAALVAAALVAGCSGIDLSGGPPREFPRESGPLTVPPHMRDGGHP